MKEDKKKNELMKIYAENIEEAFSAEKETGVYVNCEFSVNLKEGVVTHSLASTNGEDVVIIQKDQFPYDTKFKKGFLANALGSYSSNGAVTVLKSHNHSYDAEKPSKTSSLKSVSSSNNILTIKNAEIDYIEKVEDTIRKVEERKNNSSRAFSPKASGLISALTLAFLVGIFDGAVLMIILKFFIK